MRKTTVIIGALALALQGCGPPKTVVDETRESIHAAAKQEGELLCGTETPEPDVLIEQCRQGDKLISDCRFVESRLMECEFPERGIEARLVPISP